MSTKMAVPKKAKGVLRTKVGFVNTGRFGLEQTFRAFARFAAWVGRALLVVIEVNEADKPAADLDQIRQRWRLSRGYKVLFAKRSHEVLIASVHRRFAKRTVPACAALEDQTPPRVWHVARDKRRKTSLVFGHYPAGATGHNGEGTRTPAIRGALLMRYNQMDSALEDTVAVEHAAGYNVIGLSDFNDPQGLSLRSLRRKGVEVTHHGPDAIWAFPAPGYEVAAHYGQTTPLGLETEHWMHRAVIDFAPIEETK